MPLPSNKHKRERSGGIGSSEQFAKLGQIVQEGSQVSPVAPENMQGYISAPSIVQGPGQHDPNNVKVAKSSLQQLAEFGQAGASVIEARAKAKVASDRFKTKADGDLLDLTSIRASESATKWKETRNTTYSSQLEAAKVSLSPDRLAEVTTMDPETGQQEIDFDLLTGRERYIISRGVSLNSLEGKSHAEIAELLNGLPIEWNFQKQRAELLKIWKENDGKIQTPEGRIKYYQGINSINTSTSELSASEYRADLVEIVKMLDNDPSITVEEADEIIKTWNETVFSLNPELKSNGVFQQTINNMASNAHNAIIQSRIQNTTDWLNNLVNEGVVDILIDKVDENIKSNAIELPEGMTHEDMTPDILTDMVVDTMLGLLEDGPDITNPAVLDGIAKELLGTDEVPFDAESEIVKNYVYSKIFPVVSTKLGQENIIHTLILREQNDIINYHSILTPYSADGKLKKHDFSSYYPTQGKQEGDGDYMQVLGQTRKGLTESLLFSAISVASNTNIPIDERLSEGLQILSEENMLDITDGYYARTGKFESIQDKGKRKKAINTEAEIARNKALVQFYDKLTESETAAAMTRFDTAWKASMLTNTLDDDPYTQFLNMSSTISPSLDDLVNQTEGLEYYKKHGSFNPLKPSFDHFHPMNLTEEEIQKIPEDMRDDYLGLIKETWKDIDGVGHTRYSRVDPSSPIGKAVFHMFETTMQNIASSGTSSRAGNDRNLSGLAKTGDQRYAINGIIGAQQMERDAYRKAPADTGEIPTATEDLAKNLQDAEYESLVSSAALIDNVNGTRELDKYTKEAILSSMENPTDFLAMTKWFYMTNEDGKYLVSETARSSIIKELTNSSDPSYKELGFTLAYLDTKLTMQIGELPVDNEAKMRALAENSTEYSLEEDTQTLLDQARDHATSMASLNDKDVDKALLQVWDNPEEAEEDYNLDNATNVLFEILGKSGKLTTHKYTRSVDVPARQGYQSSRAYESYPETFAEAKETVLDPESAQRFLREAMLSYIIDYRMQLPIDSEGESKDVDLRSWMTNKVNEMFTTGQWNTYVDESLGDRGRVYFVPDSKNYLTGDIPATKAIFEVSSKMNIVDNYDPNSLQAVSMDTIPDNSKAFDNIERAIALTMDDYLIEEDGSFLKDNPFFTNNWIANEWVQEFYTVTRDMRESGTFDRMDSEYQRVSRNLATAVNNGAVRIPGEMSLDGEWTSHPLWDAPTALSVDSNAYRFKDAVQDWYDITGGFPSQEIYSQIGNGILTRSDVYILALNTFRGSADFQASSMLARQEPFTIDRLHAVPVTGYSHSQLGIFRNEPVFREQTKDEPDAQYQQERRAWEQTTLRNYTMNRNGYPIQFVVTDPTGKNPQELPTIYRRTLRKVDGRWKGVQDGPPVFLVNQHKVDRITKERVEQSKGKRFSLTSRLNPSIKRDIVFPDEMYTTDQSGKTVMKPRGKTETRFNSIEWDWHPIDGREPWFTITRKLGAGEMAGDIFILPTIFSETTQQLLTTDLK